MTATPWGNSEELRSRRLRPGPGTPRDEVARNQRERLMAAMVAAIDEYGYEATRVADLVEISGVSRSAFYGYFDDKRACFLATVDAIVGIASERIVAAYGSEERWDSRLRAAAGEFLELVLAQPAAARLCLVDVHAAGPEARERLDRVMASIEAAVKKAFEQSPDRAGMPREVVQAIVGGIGKAVHTRLRRREEEQLEQVLWELLDWGMSYHAPPQPLRRPRRAARPAARRQAADASIERLTRATIETAAEQGYPAATIAAIANRARASLSTFYEHFPSKEDAFRSAVAQVQADAMEATLAPCRSASDWRYGVRAGLDGLFEFLAADPAATSLGIVDVLATDACQGDDVIGGVRACLEGGYGQSPEVPGIAGEAIGAAVYNLAYSQVRKRRVERMRELTPTATFVALAPFVGTAEACTVANEPLTA